MGVRHGQTDLLAGANHQQEESVMGTGRWQVIDADGEYESELTSQLEIEHDGATPET